MKKGTMSFIFIMFVVFLTLTGCNSDSQIEEPPVENIPLAEYFPQIPNSIYNYKGEGNEYAQITVYTDYIEGDMIQQRINNGGTEIVRIYKLENGKISMIFEKPETYFRENFIGKENINSIIIQEPLEKGGKWKDSEGIEHEIIETQKNINTPMGDYNSLEIVSQNGDWINKEYYSPGVGLVKIVYENKETTVSSILESIEQGSYQRSIDLYYPNIEDGKYYFKGVPVEFFTNDITGDKIAQAYKSNEIINTGVVFSEETKINKLYIDEEGIVNIDLNQEFLTNMNAGANYESMILQSITNTFCKYYGADKLKLTIDGEEYESGHILIEKDQYLIPDYTNQISS